VRLYILSTHDENGAEEVRATTDPNKLPAMLAEYVVNPDDE
jgi:hypothetical protein